jgi:uncharacterized repeat protein (TIGR01451 family)
MPILLLCGVSLMLISCGTSYDSNVTGGGGGSAAPPTIAVPNLIVRMSHTGNFFLAQQGATYIVTVTNNGTGPTDGAVTVTDSVPTGMTLVSLTGSGWSCSSNMCLRSDVLLAGGSYPAINATVNVAANASTPETNQASLSGGGSAREIGSDATTITGASALNVTMTHRGDLSLGQESAIYTVTVSNLGPGPTIGAVAVTSKAGIPFPTSGTGWNCSFSNPQSCT